MASIENTVQLPDGRALGYAEWGAPDGRPVLDLHGIPASRLAGRFGDPAATTLGIRLLSIDRPGIGLSDRNPGYNVADWPDDVAGFADALGLEQFGVIGWSGGGPYALACGWKLADRVDGLAVVAGLGPASTSAERKGLGNTDRMLFPLSLRAPALARTALSLAARQKPAKAIASFRKEVSDTDRDVFDEVYAERGDDAIDFFLEAMRNGPAGVVDDYRSLGQPWGFSPGDVTVPTWLFHGTDDHSVPITASQTLAGVVPGATLREYAGEGHMIYISHAEEILGSFAREP